MDSQQSNMHSGIHSQLYKVYKGFIYMRDFFVIFIVVGLALSLSLSSFADDEAQLIELEQESLSHPLSKNSSTEKTTSLKELQLSANINGEIDYSNLKIKDALRRLLEISPDLIISDLRLEQSKISISQAKADTWLPEANFTLKAFTPVNLLSDKDQQDGLFTGEECKIIFRLNSDSFNKIKYEDAKYKSSLADFKQTLTNEARNLIEIYLQLALAQKSFEITNQALSDSEAILKEIKNDSRYSELEAAQAEHFNARIFEKKLTSYSRLKTARRNLKFALGLQDKPNLEISVSDTFLNIKQAENFIVSKDLQYKEYSLLVLEKKLKEAQLAEKMNYEPLIELALSVTANASQGTNNTKATTSAISSLQFNIFLTDFGYSANYKRAATGLRELSELEYRKKKLDLELKNINTKNTIDNISNRIYEIKKFIKETETAISLFKAQVKMPVNVLFKRNDQLVEARYLLKELIRDYAFDVSILDNSYIEKTNISLEYQNLDFGKLYNISKRNKTIEEQIINKKIEIEEYGLKMAKCEVRPDMRAGLSIGNKSYTDGQSKNTTIAYTSLNGKLFNQRYSYSFKRAESRLNNALAQKNLVYNEKWYEIISSYLKATQIKRRINLINEIVSLKAQIITEYQQGIESGLPKYEEVDVKPLIIEQIESNLALIKWELELAAEKNNIKRYCNIPLNEKITLKDKGIFDWQSDNERNFFLNYLREHIAPFYDARAPIKSAEFRVDEYQARENEAEAFRGLSWRLLAQARGDETDGWENPNEQISLSFSLPFWGNDKRQIEKNTERGDKLRSELELIKAKKDFEKLINQTESRYDAASSMIKNLNQELNNLSKQLEIIKEYHKRGIKSKRDLLDAKMRFLAAQLDYEDKMNSYLNSKSQLLLVLGNIETHHGEDKILIVKNLKQAVEIALHNSPEVKVYQSIYSTEKDSLKHYKSFYKDGALSSDLIYEDNKDSDNQRDVHSLVALASLDFNLINKYASRQQKAKTELSHLDLKKKKFDVALDVINAYAQYIESLATINTVKNRIFEEEEKLQSMSLKNGAKATTQMDYLRQVQILNMVKRKYASVSEESDNYKKRLILLLKGPENNCSDLKISINLEEYKTGNLPLSIKNKLSNELKNSYPQIIEPLVDEKLNSGLLRLLETKSAQQASANKIKSIIAEAGYAYLSDELAELALFEEERLSLPLLRDDDLESLHEFVTLNISAQFYDPSTPYKAKIKELDKDISQQMAVKDLREVLEEAQIIFDEYEIALMNYEYIKENVVSVEEKMQKHMDELKKVGKLSVIEEMEIIGMLIKNRTDRQKALHRIISLRNQLNHYLKKYTSKNLEDLAQFSIDKDKKNDVQRAKIIGIKH
jgi:outer membrane protein TolC